MSKTQEKETTCDKPAVAIQEPAKVGDVAETVEPAVVFRVDFKIGGEDEEVISLNHPSSEFAQLFADKVVRQGTYTKQVEGGVEIVRVESARVTGPYEVQPEVNLPPAVNE